MALGNAPRPILYSFRRCPYAMRARLALLISGTVCEIREVRLAAKPAEMITASPKGTVPVLLPGDGRVVDESLDIMRWALSRNDPEHWLAGDDIDLIAANDGPFKHHLDRYKYSQRHATDPEDHRAAGLSFLEELETRLASTTQLCGNRRSLTDMAIMPFVRQFALTDPAWFDRQPLPRLQAWLQAHLTSTLFEAAMVRLTPWQPADGETLFPAKSSGQG